MLVYSEDNEGYYFLMYFYDALLLDFSLPSCYTLIKFKMLAFIAFYGLLFFIRFKDFIFGWEDLSSYYYIPVSPLNSPIPYILSFIKFKVSPLLKTWESWFSIVNRLIAVSGLNSVYDLFFYILDSEYEIDDGLTVLSLPNKRV